MKTIFKLLAMLFICLSVLSACGGGGGDAPPPQQGSSDWDTMVWDQDDWS